jgi:chemotaxis protein MotB
MKSLLDGDPPRGGAPDWTLTYGDLMSLLLTFFVMLVSMSEMKNTDKYRGVADSLHQKFSAAAVPGLTPGVGRPRNPRLAAHAVTARQTRQRLLQELRDSAPARQPAVASRRPAEPPLNHGAARRIR